MLCLSIHVKNVTQFALTETGKIGEIELLFVGCQTWRSHPEMGLILFCAPWRKSEAAGSNSD